MMRKHRIEMIFIRERAPNVATNSSSLKHSAIPLIPRDFAIKSELLVVALNDRSLNFKLSLLIA